MKCAGISIVRFIGGFILATVVYLVGFYIAYNVQSILNHFILFLPPTIDLTQAAPTGAALISTIFGQAAFLTIAGKKAEKVSSIVGSVWFSLLATVITVLFIRGGNYAFTWFWVLSIGINIFFIWQVRHDKKKDSVET